MEQQTTEAIEESVPTETEISEPVSQTQAEMPLREAKIEVNGHGS